MFPTRVKQWWFAVGCAVGLCDGLAADAPGFRREIAPLLVEKCLSCHGEEKQKGGYRLDTYERMRTGGESGEAPIVPGAPEKSQLYRLITADDPDDRMPQKAEALSIDQIESVRRWIEAGAAFDGEKVDQPIVELDGGGPRRTAPETYPFPVPISAIALLPGERMAVSGYHEITVWDRAGRLMRRFGGLAERIQAIATSTDGSRLFYAGGNPGRGGEAGAIDPGLDGEPAVWVRSAEVLYAVALSPDGTLMAVGGGDRTIRLLRIPDGTPVRVVSGHSDWVLDLDFSPDGRHLATASRDRTARVFEVANGNLVTSYRGHDAVVTAVRFAEDGKRVVSAGRDRRIHLWAADTGRESGRIDGFNCEINRLLVKGDSVFSAGSDGRLREHGMKDRRLLREFEPGGQSVLGLALELDQGLVATTAHDGNVRLWRLSDGAMAKEFMAVP